MPLKSQTGPRLSTSSVFASFYVKWAPASGRHFCPDIGLWYQADMDYSLENWTRINPLFIKLIISGILSQKVH